MTTINSNYNYYQNGSTSSTSSTQSTQIEESLFGNNAGVTADAVENNSEKEALNAQLAQLEAQRKQLETQLSQYNIKKDSLESKKTDLERQENELKNKMVEAEQEKAESENEAAKLKEIYDKNYAKLLSLVKTMNEKIAESTQQSAQAVQEHQKKIETATKEAFEKVQSGEITEDEVANYIGNKTGDTNFIKAISTGCVGVVESLSSQIKGLISSLSKTIESMTKESECMTELDSEIASLRSDKSKVSSELNIVKGEIAVVNSDINTTTAEINQVTKDVEATEVELGIRENTYSAATTAGIPTEATAPAFGTYTASYTAATEALSEIEKQEANNPFKTVSATNYEELDLLLTTIMEQNEVSISSLRELVNRNNKILDEKQSV